MSTSPSRSSPAAPVPTLMVLVMSWNVLPTLNKAVPAAATPATVAAAAPRARPNVLPEVLPAFSASLATPFVRAGPNSLREGKTGSHKPLASATGTTTYSVICIQLYVFSYSVTLRPFSRRNPPSLSFTNLSKNRINSTLRLLTTPPVSRSLRGLNRRKILRVLPTRQRPINKPNDTHNLSRQPIQLPVGRRVPVHGRLPLLLSLQFFLQLRVRV